VGPDGATDALLTAGEVAVQMRVTKGRLYARYVEPHRGQRLGDATNR